MNRFSLGEQSGIKGLFILAALTLVGALGYHVLVPMPALPASNRGNESAISLETEEHKDQVEKLTKSVAARTWQGTAAEIGPKAIQEVTRLAATSRMTLNGIRPQRTEAVSGIESLPLVVSVEGPYPAAVSFLRSIEDPKSKLAISEIQATAADGATDRVTMTVQIIAYKGTEKKANG